jgi:hypothetical protein
MPSALPQVPATEGVTAVPSLFVAKRFQYHLVRRAEKEFAEHAAAGAALEL